jgi:beta-carotene 3-hydroxylase
MVPFCIVLASFLTMEFVAWFSHKYIMHGFMWNWHESHHRPRLGFFEKNDLFSLVFSIPAVVCILIGRAYPAIGFLVWVGIGITAYGLFYFIFHDVIVHRRIHIKYVAKSKYMKRIIRAHKIHHKKMTKEECEAFGFLYAPKKYEA